MLGFYYMSLIGKSHQLTENSVCQDASSIITLDNGWIVAAIADGIGSAKRSEVGATTAVNTVLSFIKENHPEQWHEESLISLLRVAFHKALKEIKTIVKESGEDFIEYDTTLTVAIYDGTRVVYGHVGDGGIIALSSYGDYSVLTKAQKGEAFNETFPLRSGPDYWSFGRSTDDVCSLTLMTDGLFDIAVPWILAKTDQTICISFIRPFMDNNILKLSSQVDFEKIQENVCDYLTGPQCSPITDDKTIVGIINTDVIPERKADEYYAEPDWNALYETHNKALYGEEETNTSSEDVNSDNQDPDDNTNSGKVTEGATNTNEVSISNRSFLGRMINKLIKE